MNLFLPEVGDSLVLSSDWEFSLYFHYRNKDFYKKILRCLFPINPNERFHERNYSDKDINVLFTVWPEYDPNIIPVKIRDITISDFPKDSIVNKNGLNGMVFKLPKGTVLKIDRIYIRKGKKDYSSLTFNIVDTTHSFLVDSKGKKVKGSMRFWATLDDVNKIVCEHIPA